MAIQQEQQQQQQIHPNLWMQGGSISASPAHISDSEVGFCLEAKIVIPPPGSNFGRQIINPAYWYCTIDLWFSACKMSDDKIRLPICTALFLLKNNGQSAKGRQKYALVI